MWGADERDLRLSAFIGGRFGFWGFGCVHGNLA